jgi:hypothetical protein
VDESGESSESSESKRFQGIGKGIINVVETYDHGYEPMTENVREVVVEFGRSFPEPRHLHRHALD